MLCKWVIYYWLLILNYSRQTPGAEFEADQQLSQENTHMDTMEQQVVHVTDINEELNRVEVNFTCIPFNGKSY